MARKPTISTNPTQSPKSASAAHRRRSGPGHVISPSPSAPLPTTTSTVNKHIDDINWRHPAELIHIFPEKSTQADIIPVLQKEAFSIPPSANDKSAQYTTITLIDGTGVVVPLGYRIPLMFCAKYLWESVKLVLTCTNPVQEWENFKYDLLNLSRLLHTFLQDARRANALNEGKRSTARPRGGMSPRWRSTMFDRVLTRYFWGWMINRDEYIRAFWMEFKEEEYERDAVRRDWKTWSLKGHNDFFLTQPEITNGITAEELMEGLSVVLPTRTKPLTYKWDNEAQERVDPEMRTASFNDSSQMEFVGHWEGEEGRERKRVKLDLPPANLEDVSKSKTTSPSNAGAKDVDKPATGETLHGTAHEHRNESEIAIDLDSDRETETDEKEVEAVALGGRGLPTPPPTSPVIALSSGQVNVNEREEDTRPPIRWSHTISLSTPTPSLILPPYSPPVESVSKHAMTSAASDSSQQSPNFSVPMDLGSSQTVETGVSTLSSTSNIVDVSDTRPSSLQNQAASQVVASRLDQSTTGGWAIVTPMHVDPPANAERLTPLDIPSAEERDDISMLESSPSTLSLRLQPHLTVNYANEPSSIAQHTSERRHNPEVIKQVITVVPSMLSQLQSILDIASLESGITEGITNVTALNLAGQSIPLATSLIERMNALEGEVKSNKEELVRTRRKVVDLETRLEAFETGNHFNDGSSSLCALPVVVSSGSVTPATPLSSSNIDDNVPLPIKSQRKLMQLKAMSPSSSSRGRD